MVHYGYNMEEVERSYNDVALVKFDRPFFMNTVTDASINPICLPSSSRFQDEDKQSGLNYMLLPSGFAVGFGLESQHICRTNGIGPDIYHECAAKTEITSERRHGKYMYSYSLFCRDRGKEDIGTSSQFLFLHNCTITGFKRCLLLLP